ncbi:MAG: ABC transporter permease subunit, partial [Pseudomonadales bacterium]
MFKLNPLTLQKWQRFKSIKRGYWSACILTLLILLSCVAELLINSRALIVKYNGELYFPTYTAFIPGTAFDFDYSFETNYRDLKKRVADQPDNWVLMPIVPYNPLENDLHDDKFPPFPPSLASQHYLGTDTTGRDIVARLVYGFRIAIWFAIILLLCNYLIGIALGCIMGFVGGKFDLIFQRIIEIWSNIPNLYVIMIVASIIVPSFWTLTAIMVFFGWMHMTWYMRTATYKEAARDYVMAARSIGASNSRIIFRHVLP